MSTGRNSLVGQGWGAGTGNTTGLSSGDLAPSTGQYYPGAIDANDFPAPTQALPRCSTGFTAYQLAVAGCVQRPISCGSTPTVKVDVNPYPGRDAETVAAANCLTHFNGAQGDSDRIDPANSQPPFQFIAGNQNPAASAVGKNLLVSDSLVTVPVIDVTSPPTARTPDATVIGFIQLFLNPTADSIPTNNQIPVTIINLAGCGTNATGQPIFGNGASPVAVRLISQ